MLVFPAAAPEKELNRPAPYTFFVRMGTAKEFFLPDDRQRFSKVVHCFRWISIYCRILNTVAQHLGRFLR